MVDEPDDPARACRVAALPKKSCFLKSRVYAKLVSRPILKRYQTFNAYPL
jgi:hypothetical protein